MQCCCILAILIFNFVVLCTHASPTVACTLIISGFDIDLPSPKINHITIYMYMYVYIFCVLFSLLHLFSPHSLSFLLYHSALYISVLPPSLSLSLQIEADHGRASSHERDFFINPVPGSKYIVRGLLNQLPFENLPVVNFGRKPFDWMNEDQWQKLLVNHCHYNLHVLHVYMYMYMICKFHLIIYFMVNCAYNWPCNHVRIVNN